MYLQAKQIVTLQQLRGFGPAAIMKIGGYVYDNKISIDSDSRLWEVLKKVLSAKKLSKISFNDIQTASYNALHIIEASEQKDIKVLGHWDKEFPEMLANVTDEEGKNKPCVLLYYKGNLNALQKPGLAIIGTREPDFDGIKAGKYFARMFSKQGFNIVSGLAVGCDTLGHRGALDTDGITTAFLAHGLDTIYPIENKGLADEIVERGGLLLSEYSFCTPVSRYNLVARDRLQSALAQACLVIETGRHGGTMHAARAALAANKPLFVVDYSDKNGEKKQGNEWLISQGAVRLTTSEDALERISIDIKIGSLRNTNTQLDLFA